MTGGLDLRVQVPAELAGLDWASWLADALNALRPYADPADDEIVVEPADGGRFGLTVNGRPAVVDLAGGGSSTPGSPIAVLNEVAVRLLRRLSLLDDRLARPDSVHHQLIDLGLPPWYTSDDPDPRERQQELEERPAALAPTLILLEVPSRVARHYDADSLDAVARLRESALSRYGVRLPEVRLRLTEGSDDTVRIGLNEVWTVQRLTDHADWAEVIALLESVLDGRLHWFVRAEDIESALDELSYAMPDQVANCLVHYDTATIAGCARELVRQGDSVRNLVRVIWLLLELGSWDALPDRLVLAEQPMQATVGLAPATARDPGVLASRIRGYNHEEAWRAGIDLPLGSAGRLSSEAEEQLGYAWDDIRNLVRAEFRVVEEYVELGRPATVVVRTAEAIRPVADVLQAMPRPPKVIASAELRPDADVD
jgi:hypothetical protein